MRLGEGTGCPLAFNIIEASQAVISNMATFEQAAINDDFLVDIR
jgi:nicotinate-nucleotide--dimethylbenzimidazole phosphoribosyltransferase